MTRRACKPMDKSLLRAIGRLMHLHHETHPDRVARRLNITPQYVREISKKFPPIERVTLPEALEVIGALKSPPPVSPAQPSEADPTAAT